MLPGPTFTGGFIHHNILGLPESKRSGGAQGTIGCDGCVRVTVFPTIHHLFQVTLIKKSPGMAFGKPETLTYSTYQIHFHFGKEAFPLKAQRMMTATELSSWITILKVSIHS